MSCRRKRSYILVYWWPTAGTLARVCLRSAFSRVAAYALQPSARRGVADTLVATAPRGPPGTAGPRRCGLPGARP